MNHIPVGVSAFGDGDDFSRGAVGASCEHRRRFPLRDTFPISPGPSAVVTENHPLHLSV